MQEPSDFSEDRQAASFVSRLIVKLKKADSPLFRMARAVVYFVGRPTFPRIPAFSKPFFRLFYQAHYLVIVLWRTAYTLLYCHPLFQSRCARVGKKLGLQGLPFVLGPVQIYIGDNVQIGGKVNVLSGRFLETPRLELRDRAQIGWGVTFAINKEIIVEEDTIIANDCRVSDTDGHHKNAELRAQNAPIPLREIRPVRICRYAWVGGGTYIMKGVTIGEGAIIGANSVVISDIPPYCLAIGNPAEVLLRNVGRKKTPSPGAAPASESTGPAENAAEPATVQSGSDPVVP